MSLANLSEAFELARFRAKLAEDQQHELEDLLAQWFLDGNEGALTFLREVAKEYREAHPKPPVECAPQQVIEGGYEGGNRDVESIPGDPSNLAGVARAVGALENAAQSTAQRACVSGVGARSEGTGR